MHFDQKSGFFTSLTPATEKRATPFGVAQPAMAVCIQMMTCTKRQVGRLSAAYLLPTSTHRRSVGGRSASRGRSIRRPGSMMWVQTDTSRTRQGLELVC